MEGSETQKKIDELKQEASKLRVELEEELQEHFIRLDGVQMKIRQIGLYELHDFNQRKDKLGEIVQVQKAVVILLGREREVNDAVQIISKYGSEIIKKLQEYSIGTNITENQLKMVREYTQNKSISIEKISTVSMVAAVFWNWALAIEAAETKLIEIKPKKNKFTNIQEQIRFMEASLLNNK